MRARITKKKRTEMTSVRARGKPLRKRTPPVVGSGGGLVNSQFLPFLGERFGFSKE
jgi:hypothetical protein